MNRYELLLGEVVEYDTPPAPLAAFLARVEAAAADPSVSPADLLSLAYGVENPLLDVTTYPGHAIITKDAFAHPVYRILGDLVGRKQLAATGQTAEQVAAPYTLTVKDVAEQLGLSENAVRTAISNRKLSAVKLNGGWYVRPESVASYRVSNRGRHARAATAAEAGSPPPAVRVRCGSADGYSLSVRIAGGVDLADKAKEGRAVVGRFPSGWASAAVKTTTKEGVRVFELEPAEEEHAVEFHGFEVRGPFAITKKHRSTDAAVKVWKGYAAQAQA